MTKTPKSAEKLRGFITKQYLNNPEMGSIDWNSAIQNVLIDLMHLGDSFGVNIRSRLEGAQDVYEQELNNELSAITGVSE